MLLTSVLNINRQQKKPGASLVPLRCFKFTTIPDTFVYEQDERDQFL